MEETLKQVRQMGRFAFVRGTDTHSPYITRAIAAPKALAAKVQFVTLLQPAPIRVRPQALRHTPPPPHAPLSARSHNQRLISFVKASNNPNRTSATTETADRRVIRDVLKKRRTAK